MIRKIMPESSVDTTLGKNIDLSYPYDIIDMALTEGDAATLVDKYKEAYGPGFEVKFVEGEEETNP